MLKWKKALSSILIASMLLSVTACGNKEEESKETKSTTESTTESGSSEQTTADNTETSEGLPAIYDLKLGEDYTDISADLQILTHRTDIVDTVFAQYIQDFQALYPNINIEYEAVTDYSEDVTIRLTTGTWGDICMIPTSLSKNELPNLFTSYGKLEELNKVYNFNNNFAFEEEVYGIASTGNAQGIVYNKKVFEEAGIAEIPKTPEDFLAALQQIKDNTDAIPLYSNFAAGWTMGAWDAYIGGSATGDPDFMNIGLVHGKDPFANRGDMTGPYAVYYVLYESAARGLIEDDPTTTDWEGCKGMINNGEIGTMVLGSWAVTQMQEAGPNPDDIGYMSFPITVNGKQYASAGPDYTYGININASEEEKIASMLYVKWLTEKSNFAYDQGGIPIDKTAEFPSVLAAFEGIEFVVDNPAPAGEETLFNDINNDSEVGINSDNYPDSNILEQAVTGGDTLDEIMAQWNEKWSKAQEKFNVEIYE